MVIIVFSKGLLSRLFALIGSGFDSERPTEESKKSGCACVVEQGGRGGGMEGGGNPGERGGKSTGFPSWLEPEEIRTIPNQDLGVQGAGS